MAWSFLTESGWLHPKWQSNVFEIGNSLSAFAFCWKGKKGLIKDALLLHTYILLQFIARTFGTDSLAKPLSKALIRDLLKLDPTALKGSFHLCFRKSKVEKGGRYVHLSEKRHVYAYIEKFLFLYFASTRVLCKVVCTHYALYTNAVWHHSDLSATKTNDVTLWHKYLITSPSSTLCTYGQDCQQYSR